MGITVAMYSHDSVGLGHARRNRAIAYALAETLPELTGQTTTGLLIAGHPNASQDSLPEGWDWLLLPGISRTTDGYTARNLGMDLDALAQLRSCTISAVLEAISPDLFIVDRHAFGIAGELKPALRVLREQHGCTTVLGMREVLDTPSVVAREWQEIGGGTEAARHYDAIWVYGDARVYDPVATGEIPAEFADRAYHTGYLAHGRPADEGRTVDVPYLLTMVGGGSDGGRIARAAARAPVPAGHRHLIVTGPQMPEHDVASVRTAVAGNRTQSSLPSGPDGGAQPRIRVIRSAANIPELIAGAAGVVCMGGYNSLAEVMATDTPALVVPRASRRDEQPRRAGALAAVGAVETLPAAQLSPQAVGDWFTTAVGRRVSREAIDLDGLRTVAGLAADLLRDPHELTAGPAHHTAPPEVYTDVR